ncbi:protein KTI12 [Nematocida ausubeli]|nr:protein KTI12 [Nematocida ausubeli]
MPLFILSGLPSRAKKDLFCDILQQVIRKYSTNSGEDAEGAQEKTIDSVLVVIQNSVSVDAKKETATMRSIIQNNLSKRVLVAIYAPLHIKGLRYEISSTAKNMGIDMAHVYCSAEYQAEGEISLPEMEEMLQGKGSMLDISTKTEKTEEFSVVSRIFETPRRADKWDAPCFIADSANIKVCAETAGDKVWALLQNVVKPRTSSKKLTGGTLNTKYLQSVKEIINRVLEEKRKSTEIPLKIARQAEIDVLSSIRTTPPPLEKVQEIFLFFLEKYLSG